MTYILRGYNVIPTRHNWKLLLFRRYIMESRILFLK